MAAGLLFVVLFPLLSLALLRRADVAPPAGGPEPAVARAVSPAPPEG